MDKKSKHKTAVKKKTLNPEFNEVQGAGEATEKPLVLLWDRGPRGTGFSSVTVRASRVRRKDGEGLTGEPSAMGAWTKLNQTEVVQMEGRGWLEKIFRG